jgi:hypothetical protein
MFCHFEGIREIFYNNKINYIRFLTFVRNDNKPYYDAVSLWERDGVRGYVTRSVASG